MFAYSFLAMTSHNILKPVYKSKFIDQLGPTTCPRCRWPRRLIGVLMQSAAARSADPPSIVIPVTQSVSSWCWSIFWALLGPGAAWVTVALYFFGQILGVLLISQFWTLANEVYDARQAKRLFGLIGGGACLGGALGASITAITVEEFGANNLLLVSAGILGCAGIVLEIVRLPHAGHQLEAMDERGVGGREAFGCWRNRSHLRGLAAVVGFAAVGAAMVDQQLSMAADASGIDADAIAVLLAQVTMLPVGCRVRRRSLAHEPDSPLVRYRCGAASAANWSWRQRDPDSDYRVSSGAVAAARVLDTTLRYSVDKSTREVLFLPLPADLRFRAKPFIDVTMDRFAKAVAAPS